MMRFWRSYICPALLITLVWVLVVLLMSNVQMIKVHKRIYESNRYQLANILKSQNNNLMTSASIENSSSLRISNINHDEYVDFNDVLKYIDLRSRLRYNLTAANDAISTPVKKLRKTKVIMHINKRKSFVNIKKRKTKIKKLGKKYKKKLDHLKHHHASGSVSGSASGLESRLLKNNINQSKAALNIAEIPKIFNKSAESQKTSMKENLNHTKILSEVKVSLRQNKI